MFESTEYLVVGGDSLVGGGLVRALERRGHGFLASTRRRERLGERRVPVDFEDPSTYAVPDGVRYAFVIAAATNYERCETDPQARRINVELIPDYVLTLLDAGVFVTFISTNSVFGGERPWPAEDDPHAPGIAYAEQKSEGEARIRDGLAQLGAGERYATVRLTKILDSRTPPLPRWMEAWKRGDIVRPFSDLIFAPMSVRFVGEALATVGESRASGNLHLSGADNVSYVDLARAFASRHDIDSSLIAPTTATAMGVNIAFKPRYSGLGMRRTTELTGLAPQPLKDVVEDVCQELSARSDAAGVGT